MNVTEPIRRHAASIPDAPAFVRHGGEVVSYARFERTIDTVARRALALGLAPGQCAVLAAPDLYRQVVVALALARIGVAHGPANLPERFPSAAILAAGAPYSGSARRIALDDLWIGGGDTAPVVMSAGGAATFMYCPTSGSTGVPKFVPISHEISLRRTRMRPATGIGDGRGMAATRLASLVGSGTSYGFNSALFVLHGGGAFVQHPSGNRAVRDWLAQSGVNYLIASPITLQKTLQALPGIIRNTLETIEVGGGSLSRSIYDEACARLCASITMGYGFTECGRVASAPMREVQDRNGGVGYACPGVEVRIVDAAGVTLPPGSEGLLSVRSAASARGYLDSPAEEAKVFRDGWVHAGDRAILEADGYLRITGRDDESINLGGVKVQSQAIERALLALGGVREVAVFGVARPDAPLALCAAVVPSATLDAQAYHRRCREHLGTRTPMVIMHLPELPRNEMGKVQRAELVAAVLHHKGWAAGT